MILVFGSLKPHSTRPQFKVMRNLLLIFADFFRLRAIDQCVVEYVKVVTS